ncbi:TRAP transporter permease [Paenibacillus chungangensis]|uniref:TRAP transporter permease n=1 Tax=Paenibacillus chungangensis TaxID=696535 RepID=A0ABW3HR28_9BACL
MIVSVRSSIVLLLCVLLSLYHFCTSGFGYLPGVGSRTHLVIHLVFGLSLVYLLYPLMKDGKRRYSVWLDYALAACCIGIGVYMMINLKSPSILSARMTFVDLLVAIALVVLVLEATRRVVGKALVIIAGVFIAYYFLGAYLLYPFRHSRADFERFFYEMSFTTSGIFGTPLTVSANYVFIFILFGAILEATGAGKMFIDLALRAFGRYRGGPAKAAVVSSGMLGSISGSSIANAVTTGTFTIPLMKKVGFKPHVAGGIEVAASSSGQLLPPIMGAAAFLMIEYTGYAYVEIIRSALIPALLSYLAILLMVHFEAVKNRISGLKREELVSGKSLLLRQGYLIFPIAVLIFFLASGKTVGNSAFFSIVILMVIAYFASLLQRRLPIGLLIAIVLSAVVYGMSAFFGWPVEIAVVCVLGVAIALLFVLLQRAAKQESQPLRFGLRELAAGLELAAKNALSVIVACATAGMMIGIVNLTGLSSKLPHIIVGFARDVASWLPSFAAAYSDSIQLYAALVLTVVACLILGLGLPTTATYVILAAMVAPALVTLGLPVMTAHLFVLYYGVLADDTPPINLPAYATAGIAGANPISTGVQGFKFDSGALLLPFAFVANPNLLLLNPDVSPWVLGLNIGTALLGIVALASFIQKWLFSAYRSYERWLAFLAALVLIHGSWITDAVGIAVLALLGVLTYRRRESASRSGEVEERAAGMGG